MPRGKETKAGDGKTIKLRYGDYQIIVDWLESGGKDRLFGVGRTNVFGQKNKTKQEAFKELADTVNEHQKRDSSLVNVDPSSMKNRWKHYFHKYRDARRRADTPGFSIEEEDVKMGVTTVEQKLEQFCPFYLRMDAMFHDRVTVEPLGFDETIAPEDDMCKAEREEDCLDVVTVLDSRVKELPEQGRRVDSERESTQCTAPPKESAVDSVRPAKIQKWISPGTMRGSIKGFQLLSSKPNKDPQHGVNEAFMELGRDRIRLSKEKMRWKMQVAEQHQVIERERLALDIRKHDDLLKQSQNSAKASLIQGALNSGKTLDEIKALLDLAFS